MNEIILLPLLFYDKSLLDYLKSNITKVIGMPVSISDKEINIKPYYNSERAQYDAAKIIQHTENDTQSLTIICTSADLYIPIFTYVFGLAKLNGRVAIISSHRLENSFYGLKDDRERLEERMLKEVIHELGHLAGLRHCTQPNCVMASSTSSDELDVKESFYCKVCLKRLMDPNNENNNFVTRFLEKIVASQ